MIYNEEIALEKRIYKSKDIAEMNLNNIYKDKWPILKRQTEHEWFYCMMDPIGKNAYRDPNIEENTRIMLGTGIEHIPKFRFLKLNPDNPFIFLRTMYHSWTLWAWSIWLENQNYMKTPLLIHIDSHDDLEKPSIRWTPNMGIFLSPLNNQILDLRNSTTVIPFIEQGFIGIGGFILPFLHTISSCNIIHIYPDENYSEEKKWLIPIREHIHYLGNSAWRPALKVVKNREEINGSCFSYTITSDLSVIKQLDYDGPVLLDIDFDFFCNKFDNKSIKESQCSLKNIRETINELARLLYLSNIKNKIEVVTLALSPGFFPSTYWIDSINSLESILYNNLRRPSI